MADDKKNSANLPALINKPAIQKRFAEVLGKNSPAFISALLNVYNGNAQLQKCTPNSILGAAGLAAVTGLSINPSLGHAYILPFGNQAQFLLGWKGLIQLALRSNRYLAINATEVYDGEVRGRDVKTGEPIYGEKTSDEVIGYLAYFKLTNGFEKTLYMTVEQVRNHAKKYSKSYSSDAKNGANSSVWSTNFDAMAKKTVLKLLLNKYGPLTAELYQVMQADQAVVAKTSYTYVDNSGDTVPRETIDIDWNSEFVDEDTGEIYKPENSEAGSETEKFTFLD